MSNFEKFFLKDISNSQTGPFGTQLHKEDYVTDGTPIVTVEHLGEISFNLENLPMVSDKDKERLSKYVLKEGDIVFSRVGSIDRCTYVSEKEDGWLFSGRCIRVRFNEKADARYVSFYFRQKYFKEMMLNISVGAIMPSLNTSLMDNLPIFLPSKIIQQKIAAVLSSLDSKIELNNRINTELEAMAKTLYDYWFVQFDFPDKDGKPYKTSGGKMVWNEELKRAIPDGWDVSELRNLVDVVKGNISPADILPTTPYVGLEHIGRKTIVLSDWTTSDRASSDKTVFKKHDILFGKIRPYFHKVAVALFDGITSTDTILLRPKKSEYFGLALETVFTEKFVNTATSSSTGSKMPRADWNVLQHYKIPVPDLRLLQSYQELFDKVLAKIEISVIESRKLTQLRDWLLPMLMNGQVQVMPINHQR